MIRENTVCMVSTRASYPAGEAPFSPSARYPEAPFGDVAKDDNTVYDAVRRGFLSMRLDESRIGTPRWNPLSELISPGQTVLLKPNWVLHTNGGASGDETDCLVTHPSVVRAVLDYVVLALGKTGRIIIGDAPIQLCDLETLWQKTGYDKLFAFYREKGIPIETLDFRRLTAQRRKDDTFAVSKHEERAGVLVDLGERSLFAQMQREQIDRLRITNYPVGRIALAHNGGSHCYLIHPAALEADVVINLPKPKSHRKAGLTAAAKNFVGVNADKEYLPHHMALGAAGGDEYAHDTILLRAASYMRDAFNNLNYRQNRFAPIARFFAKGLEKTGRTLAGERFREGSWYGNDTIWRTVTDLNRIMEYADRTGDMHTEKQRRLFHICDMVIAGEGEGPLEPTPKPLGLLVMGESAAAVDRVICEIVGFHADKVRYIRPMLDGQGMSDDDIRVLCETGSLSPLREIQWQTDRFLRPADGWRGHIEKEDAR